MAFFNRQRQLNPPPDIASGPAPMFNMQEQGPPPPIADQSGGIGPDPSVIQALMAQMAQSGMNQRPAVMPRTPMPNVPVGLQAPDTSGVGNQSIQQNKMQQRQPQMGAQPQQAQMMKRRPMPMMTRPTGMGIGPTQPPMMGPTQGTIGAGAPPPNRIQY